MGPSIFPENSSFLFYPFLVTLRDASLVKETYEYPSTFLSLVRSLFITKFCCLEKNIVLSFVSYRTGRHEDSAGFSFDGIRLCHTNTGTPTDIPTATSTPTNGQRDNGHWI